MDNYGLDILALSEVRWTGAGSQTLKKGSTILHSGTEKKKEAGVAIMLSKSASRALTKWTPINERIIVARFTGRQAKLTVVACYAPTNEADDTTKDNFTTPYKLSPRISPATISSALLVTSTPRWGATSPIVLRFLGAKASAK
ncbi:hypothetical protein QYM36_002050 [Artemia franciscana]|uniref:Uncharacterized protein n=1 Tax=Artemia franciscana TaxID=6661 RepID=A0AA88IG17_ARTSF|nr:hypothetical protein QYM36_002050 [Artemia franciscana]